MKARYLFVVKKANKSEANSAFENAGLGSHTFSGAGYGSSASGPATHYLCSIVEEEGILNGLKELGIFEKVQVGDENVDGLLSELGIVPIKPKRIKDMQ